jgi:exodeoxyribonuclease-1
MAAAQTFFWYDLETSGINPRTDRVMQFAGQRTDLELKPVGESFNLLVKLTEDTLPDPDAILLTGITPQQTLQDGLTEVEFLKLFYEQIAIPGTIFVGYNSVRFDDEFMRCLNYRNFYDAYQWQWQDGRGKWDLLDVVRITRALRPEGIEWPVDSEGRATNRLELLTKLNGLDHEHAHDALNDVWACIAVAKLIREKQPKLFAWLLELRDKKAVKNFLDKNRTFIYTSGKYDTMVEKTAVVTQLNRDDKAALVYDLRHDPAEFINLKPAELAKRWQWTRDEAAPKRLPVKTLKYNRCPALSPAGPLSEADVQKRLQVTPELVAKHLKTLQAAPDFVTNLLKARQMLDAEREEAQKDVKKTCDECLYDNLFDEHDCQLLPVVRAARPDELAGLAEDFHDMRLQDMLPLYKARNFAKALTDEERAAWERERTHRLLDGGTESRLARFMRRLQELAAEPDLNADKRYLLEELQLYAESIMPVPGGDS